MDTIIAIANPVRAGPNVSVFIASNTVSGVFDCSTNGF